MRIYNGDILDNCRKAHRKFRITNSAFRIKDTADIPTQLIYRTFHFQGVHYDPLPI